MIDADRLAHEALQADSVRDQLVRWWGDAVLDASGAVDRKAVGAIVFGDAGKLRQLESVIHPRVHAGRASARQRMLADPAVAGSSRTARCWSNRGWMRTATRSCSWIARERCGPSALQASRGWDEAELKKRERQHQRPLDIKRQAADYVINNAVNR